MKITLHQNGWTGIVEDLDFAKITQDEVDQLAWHLAIKTCVVVRNQGHLTPEDQTRVAHMFGNVESVEHKQVKVLYDSLVLPNTNSEIIRVTGELDEHGKPGLFGHVSDLDWHCNKPSDPDRKPLVWLFSVRGSVGSRTSWTNNVLAYQELDPDLKEQIKDLKLICGYKRGSFSEFSWGGLKDNQFNRHYTPSIVHTNQGGQTGLFFPFLQFRNFAGMSVDDSMAIVEKLKNHILQEKYMYHHDWQDGDVVISEQWLGLHKRWKFDGMDKRVLHRITFDFENIEFSKFQPA
jgi:alpha-ketoglutarate-dependent taurine dioxygenase